MMPRTYRFTLRTTAVLFAFLFTAHAACTMSAAAQVVLPKEDPQGAIDRREEEYRRSLERKKHPGFEEDVRGRDEWFMFQRRFPYEMVPAGARDQALRRLQAMQSRMDESREKGDRFARLLGANRWEPIGPLNVAGRITAIAYHPEQTNVVYIGAASGGVWKSVDSGATWATTFDNQESLTIGAIAVDYSRPSTIFAGSGEPYAHSEEYFGHGIFKSTDDGATWRNVGLFNVGGFSKLYVHRGNHLIVYAAGAKENGGFYRSTDGGEHWTRTLSGTMYDLTVNPANSDELFVATPDAVYYSNDGGLSFTKRSTGINVASSKRLSVAMAPSDPKKVYVLIARAKPNDLPDYAEFYASTDGGLTWRQRHEFGGGFFNEQGHYNNAVLVHPTDPDVVLVCGIDVLRTDDAGDNFINWTECYANLGVLGAVHPDQHAIEFNPKNPNRVLLGNDGGLFVSDSGGMGFRRATLALPITQFYKMDIDLNNPGRVYGGTQDNGSTGYFGTGDRTTWTSLSGADGFFVATDPYQPDIVYSEIYYGSPIYKTNVTRPGVNEQIDDFIERLGGDRGDWASPLVTSLADGKLYSGRRYLWRTGDGGKTWDRLRPGTSGLMSAIGLSPFEPKIIIGTNNGEVRYSLDDGKTWRTSAGLPRRVISDLRFDFNLEHRLYASASGIGSGHVFRSDDDGANFVDITGNLPDSPVNAVAVDPANSDHLFVGTDAGAYVTVDGGKVWFPFNDGLPLAPVVDLKISDATRMLYAATHGRSMFRVSIAAIESQPLLVRPTGGTYQTPGPLTVSWSGFSAPVRVSISYDGGSNFTEMARDVAGDSVVLALPVARTSNARVKVEENGSGRTLLSGEFTLTAKTNGVEFTRRGFVPSAIEVRRGFVWACDRESDSLEVLHLAPPTSRVAIQRSGFTGIVRDLAYDSVADRFYALVTAADMSAPKLYRMDTLGAAQGEVPLPVAIDRASGVAVTGEGIVVVTPGADGRAYVLSDAGELRRSIAAFNAAVEGDRRSLAWDGRGLVQAIVTADPNAPFDGRLERCAAGDTLRVAEAIPAVLPSGKRIEFVGLAADVSDPAQTVYWASDTAGAFYRFAQLFSGVETSSGQVYRSRSLAFSDVGPNPARDRATVRFDAVRGGRVMLDVHTADGARVLRAFSETIESGAHTITIDVGSLASGVYYLVLAGDRGDRDTWPLVVVR